MQPGSDFTVNGAYLTAANVSVAIAPESASASVGVSPVFEADFNGSGSGTGGAADIVASGGTGAVVTATNVSDTVVSTSPFSSTGGFLSEQFYFRRSKLFGVSRHFHSQQCRQFLERNYRVYYRQWR